MKHLITLMAILGLIGCTSSIEMGVGYNDSFFATNNDYEWDDGGCVGFYGQARLERKLSPRVVAAAHWTHISQWDCGPPFNDDAESSVDHIGGSIKFRITDQRKW